MPEKNASVKWIGINNVSHHCADELAKQAEKPQKHADDAAASGASQQIIKK